MKNLDGIIKKVHVTEKGTALSEKQNKYLFVVDQSANKLEIKKAVEKLFKVSVSTVNTMRYLGKMKRNRMWRQVSRKPDWKRAVVTLKEGSKIELA